MAATDYQREKTGHPGIYKVLRKSDGTWVSTQVDWRDASGKQSVKTFHGKGNLGEAKRWKDENVRYRDTSGRPDTSAGKISLREVYEEMIGHAASRGESYAPKTLELHGLIWRKLAKSDKTLAGSEIRKVSPARVTKALSGIEAREVQSKARALLQRVSNFALSRNYITAPIVEKDFTPRTRAARVKRRALEAKPERMPSTDEVARLGAAVPDRYRALILVMAFEGLRPGGGVRAQGGRPRLRRRNDLYSQDPEQRAGGADQDRGDPNAADDPRTRDDRNPARAPRAIPV